MIEKNERVQYYIKLSYKVTRLLHILCIIALNILPMRNIYRLVLSALNFITYLLVTVFVKKNPFPFTFH